MNEPTRPRPDTQSTKEARRELRKAEAGDIAGADRLRKAEQENPAATEAAEQIAADGPGERGVSR